VRPSIQPAARHETKDAGGENHYWPAQPRRSSTSFRRTDARQSARTTHQNRRVEVLSEFRSFWITPHARLRRAMPGRDSAAKCSI
jgi:hypothetical protein